MEKLVAIILSRFSSYKRVKELAPGVVGEPPNALLAASPGTITLKLPRKGQSGLEEITIEVGGGQIVPITPRELVEATGVVYGLYFS